MKMDKVAGSGNDEFYTPKYTIGNIGTVDAIELDQGEHIYHVTFENDLEDWNYKECQLEHVEEINK